MHNRQTVARTHSNGASAHKPTHTQISFITTFKQIAALFTQKKTYINTQTYLAASPEIVEKNIRGQMVHPITTINDRL
jgi:hypothetical protein